MTRRVAGDGTFTVDGAVFEVRGRHLVGRKVDVVTDPFGGPPLRVVHDGQPVTFGPCDPKANRHRRRAPDLDAPAPTVPFDPIAALLAKARKEKP